MDSVYFDPQFTDDERRQKLFEGQLVVLSPKKSTLDFCEFARGLIEEAFAPHAPETAQFNVPVTEFADVLQVLKPKFIHHPESKRLLRNVLEDYGCDIRKTYYEVPKLRSSTSDDYLTTGIAYAWHPHRDTWTAALPAQINWWIPIYPVVPENVMAFHPQYWGNPVRNGSRRYNYYEWNRTSRLSAAQYIKTDTRDQPKPEEPVQLEPQVRVVPEAGGVMLFSGNQLHSTVPNTSGRTRFSIDFRTVNIDDVIARREAPNFDSECTGTSIRDFLRASDFERIDEGVALEYEGLMPTDG